MTRNQIIAEALDLPEWERKQIALVLVASTLNAMPRAESFKLAEYAESNKLQELLKD